MPNELRRDLEMVICVGCVLGRVQVEEKRAKQEFAEKRHRMFEWLHTQVGNFDITSSRINKQ